ncbi:NAD(P)/FAD-dependent oxidoreductase [PVC group bacterium]|nr:NAD(P)/FAD-dependent oxidoreductase [PVC group bacterium]
MQRKRNINHITCDVVIIGAGAAGLMCAIEAGKRGRSVIVLERNFKVGKKIRISGGGRCNFTNIHSGPENFISNNPHFCKSALSRYTPSDICGLLDKHDIAYHEKKLGQLFCNKSAQDVIDMLVEECEEAGAEICLGSNIVKIVKGHVFCIDTEKERILSENLVVASGGLSVPTIGATGLGYELARQFGLKITETRPGLSGVTFTKSDLDVFGELSGISVLAIVKLGKDSFKENILFTHRGLSGPAILQISSYWKRGDRLEIDLLPDVNIIEVFESELKNKVEMKNVVARYMPKRLADRLFDGYVVNKPMNRYFGRSFEDAAKKLHRWLVKPRDLEGYGKAEVTVGGVDTVELSSKTMEVKKEKGLYFIGEVVDVTGHLGGHNFQWAWASGYVAGQCM